MMEESIGSEIGILSNLIRRKIRFSDAQMEDPPTGMQCHILHYLTVAEQRRQGDRFQRDIETFFHMRRSTATGMLKLLEQHGWIQREPVAYDARLKRLVLTDKARNLDESIQKRLKWTENRMRRGISDDDLQVWFRVCGKIRANLEQPPEERPPAESSSSALASCSPEPASCAAPDTYTDNHTDAPIERRECR